MFTRMAAFLQCCAARLAGVIHTVRKDDDMHEAATPFLLAGGTLLAVLGRVFGRINGRFDGD